MSGTLDRNGELDHYRAKGNGNLKSVVRMVMNSDSGELRANEPVHAALGKDLDENQMKLSSEESLVRNRALLHYMATLAISNSETDKFSYEFVQSLLDGGGNLNQAMDVYGQTIFHEVARSWNLDVAAFLIKNGADLNQQDKYGRSPLHVCAAADHCDMVEFLLQNGADIDSRSNGDEQTSLHFAAKSDAGRSLKALLGFGANIDSLDHIGRTPLQVASELSRDVSVRILIEEGASSCIYDVNGNSAMTFLSRKLPNLALEALDQLHVSDTITKCELFYLNLLEESRQKPETKKARTPLETAVINRHVNILMHPVMQRLIEVKWRQYGRFGTMLDLMVNLFYAILFTVFAVSTPGDGKHLYSPGKSKSWRVLIGMILILVTAYQMYLQIRTTIQSHKKQKQWVKWRTRQLKDELQYCHPKWQEEKYIRDEIKLIKSMPLLSTMDAWFFFDWLVIVLILVTIALNLAYYHINTASLRNSYIRVLSVLMVLVWLRILKYLRPFPGIGTLVLILGATGGDFVNWGFFFLLLFIPFTACFWIIFGGISENNVSGFAKVPRLIYTMVQMSVGEDFNLEGIVEADPVMARLLCSTFITAMVVVCLNILIAYISNTFTSVYSNAVENTTMQRAVNILNIEKFLTKTRMRKYFNYIHENANPETVQSSAVNLGSDKRSAEKSAEQFHKDFQKTHNILNQRFKKRVGCEKKSTFDVLLRDVDRLKRNQNNTVGDLKRIQDCVEQLSLLLCGSALKPKIDHRHEVVSLVESDPHISGHQTERETSIGLPGGSEAAFLPSPKNETKNKTKRVVTIPPKESNKREILDTLSDEMGEKSDETHDDSDDDGGGAKTTRRGSLVNLPHASNSPSKHKFENKSPRKIRFAFDGEDDSQRSHYEERLETNKNQRYSKKKTDLGRRNKQEPDEESNEPEGHRQQRDTTGYQGQRQGRSKSQGRRDQQHLQYSTRHQSRRHDRRGSEDVERTVATDIASTSLVPYASPGRNAFSNPAFTVDPHSQENWDDWEKVSIDSISL